MAIKITQIKPEGAQKSAPSAKDYSGEKSGGGRIRITKIPGAEQQRVIAAGGRKPQQPTVYQQALDAAMERANETNKKINDRSRKRNSRSHAQELREITGDRTKTDIGSLVKSAAQGYAADMVGAADTLLRLPSGLNYAASQERGEIEAAKKNVAMYEEKLKTAKSDEERAQIQKLLDRNKRIIEIDSEYAGKQTENYRNLTKGAQETLQRTYQNLRSSAAENMQKANEGQSAVGQLLNNVAVAGMQMGADTAVGLGRALVPMAARVFGGSSQEAMEEGIQPDMTDAERLDMQNRALLYGAGSAGVSILSEKLSNVAAPFKKAFGSGVLDKAINRAVAKMGDNAAGKIAMSFASEGFEEMFEDAVQPVLQSIYNGQSVGKNYSELEISDMLYDGLVGGILGGLGGAVEAVQRRGYYDSGTKLPDAEADRQRAFQEEVNRQIQRAQTQQEAASKEKGSTGTVLNMEKTSPQVTPEAPQRANASVDLTVPQATSDVKTQGMQNGAQTPLQNAAETDTISKGTFSLKEELKNGRAREESRDSFLRRAPDEGYRVLEGDSIAYGYRSDKSVLGNETGAGQIQKELRALGVNCEITDGTVLWNLNGISGTREIREAVTVDGKTVLINKNTDMPAKQVAGHEAFHLWKRSDARNAYIEAVEDNLIYTSPEFQQYQSAISQAYLGGEADLSNTAQFNKLREELLAYISGDIHEGTNDEFLRPMFRDYDAVKAAWESLTGAQKAQAPNNTTAGGIDNAGSQTQYEPGGAEPAQAGEGSILSGGDGGRDAGARAGEQAGIVEGGGSQRAPERSGAAIERQNLARNLRLERVSSTELGIRQGTDAKSVTVLPENAWDAELQETAQRIRRETGKKTTMVLGTIPIATRDGVTRVRGVWASDGIIIQADNMKVSPSQIASHEIFHEYADQNPGLIQAVERSIREKYGDQEFDRIVESYIRNLRGIIDIDENAADYEVEQALLDVKNEILADAYADINAFGQNAGKYREEVRQTLRERGITDSGSETAAATERRTGPPERYSLNEDFTRRFDEWLDRKPGAAGGGSFLVGTTSDALKSIGVADYEIYWRKAKIAKIMSEHPAMTADVIKSVPNVLENPILVMQSQTVANRITLFGETVDSDGKPVLAALELSPQNKKGEIQDFAVIASAYGKNNAQQLIDNSDILYIDPNKKRTDGWLGLLRLQLPSRLANYGSIGTVTYASRDVNGNLSFGEGNGKTAMQEAFEKAQIKKAGRSENSDESTAKPVIAEKSPSVKPRTFSEEIMHQLTGGDSENKPETANAEPNTVGAFTNNSQSLGGSAPAISSASGDSISRNGGNVKPKQRFSMEEPVEETKTLIAMHNMTEEKLRRTLDLGAWPSPSIAIVKAKDGHSNYGEYSAIFPRETIDPQADSRNHVYGGDAWTPTHDNALVEREVNYAARRAFDSRIGELSSQFAGGIFRGGSTLGKIGLENETRWEPGEIAEKLANYPEVQAAYLQSRGESLEPERRSKRFDRNYSNETIQRYLDSVGAQEVARLNVKLLTGGHLTEAEAALAKKAIREAYAEEHANFLNRRPESKEKRIDYYMQNNVTPNRVEDFVRSAEAFYESGGAGSETDKEATAAKMFEMIAPGGSWGDALRTVKDWVQPQLDGLLGERGVYNGKDAVTDSGRRSFAETHWDYTAENIVKAMNMASDKGANMYGVTPETLAATATPEFRSVDEMHAGEDRLRTESQDAHDRALRDLGVELDRVVDDLMRTTKHRHSNTLEEEQALSGIIAEAAKGKRTASAVKAAFRKEGYAISDGHAASILRLIERAASIPTGYYEAKPQRVVPFTESVAVVAPDNAPADLLSEMREAGMNVIEYAAGDDADRLEKINGIKDIRFSAEDAAADEALRRAREEADEELADRAAEQYRKEQREKGIAAYSKPTIAKKELQKAILNIFSVPVQERDALRTFIDQYADSVIKNGQLTNRERNAFFNKMYESGIIKTTADEAMQATGQYVAHRKVYVPENVKALFGKDWNSFRKRAYAADVYFTNDQSAIGVDAFNAELSEQLPTIFDKTETDGRRVLEHVVQLAEEGQAERMSLSDYIAEVAGKNPAYADRLVDGLEAKMDQALKTFAEKAGLETKLRSQSLRQQLAERDRRIEAARRRRENRELRELQQKTLKQLQWLSKNRDRAPEALKEAWDDVLGDIDIYAASAANELHWSKKHNATWGDLRDIYLKAKAEDPNFLPSDELEHIVARLDKDKIADMDLDALRDLYNAAVGLRTEYYNRNKVLGDDEFREFNEIYLDATQEIKDAPKGKKHGGAAGELFDELINDQQLSPMNVMQRMGGWNPDGAFYSMAKQLEQGERAVRDYAVKANRLLEDFLNKHQDWVKKADGQGKDAIWYKLEVPELTKLEMGDKPIFGDTVTVYMTPAQKVHLYLESKNYSNLRHMTGGRKFVDRELYSRGKRAEALDKGTTIKLAPETVKKLVSDLTPEEAELARILEQYYNTFAPKEINRVSNVLLGYDKANTKNYAPIYTDQNYTKSEFGVFDVTAEGVGNLKKRKVSTTPSLNISAFDAFEKHVDQTARYTGMAIPTRNMNSLMNWRGASDSMQDTIAHEWGGKANQYIKDLVTEMQGGKSEKKTVLEIIPERAFSNYISAVFGANPSIILKQLGSIPMGSAYLGMENLPSVKQIRGIDEKLISRYTQELAWRTMGYSMPETRQLKDNPNWTETNKFINSTFGGGAITAMDGWAASVLWPQAENKVRRERPELEIGTDEQVKNGTSPFYQAVAKEFNDAVARSQSTSDIIHQGTLRRSKNSITRAFTMFKSDSSQTYNAIRQKYGEWQYYKKSGASEETLKKAKKGLGEAVLAALVNAVWSGTVTFAMAALKNGAKRYRDDDDELTAASILKEFGTGLVGDLAGVMVGGEELAEIIGNGITGEKWYRIETPGLEQLDDLLENITEKFSSMGEHVGEFVNIRENGGSISEYMRREGNNLVGWIRDVAKDVATYIPGVPVNNIETYLLGVVRSISPEAAAAYEDAFTRVEKSDLKHTHGRTLKAKTRDLLKDRTGSGRKETADAVAELYDSGYTKALPSATPSSVTVNKVEHKLNAYQTQVYEMAWRKAISGELDEMVQLPVFRRASEEMREKMLDKLYSYASDMAKAAVFDDYEPKTSTQTMSENAKHGLTVAVQIVSEVGKESDPKGLSLPTLGD